MTALNEVTTVLLFIERINAADVRAISALMTDDHVFIDGLGNRVQGRDKMRAAWNAYYAGFPDYRISHEEVLHNGHVVAVFGTASATYATGGKPPKENHWEIPAAWKAIVRGGRIAEWRVYCDNQPARKLLGYETP